LKFSAKDVDSKKIVKNRKGNFVLSKTDEVKIQINAELFIKNPSSLLKKLSTEVIIPTSKTASLHIASSRARHTTLYKN
jgi:hypothetical protein